MAKTKITLVEGIHYGKNEFRDGRAVFYITLGRTHDWNTELYCFKRTKKVLLVVGCREFKTRNEAEGHWHNNVSRETNQPRPHAKALINYVSAICKANGWTW